MEIHAIAGAVLLVGLAPLWLIAPLPPSKGFAILALWTVLLSISQYSHNYRRLDYLSGRRGTYAVLWVLSLLFHVGFAVYLGFVSTWWTPAAMLPTAFAGSFFVTRSTDAVVFSIGGPKAIVALNAALGGPAVLWKAILATIMFVIANDSGS